MPISPISRGKNLGYGGRSPRLSGSIVVDLGKRMNQVLEINTTDYYCVVQPGVSYFQLYDEIKKRGLESTVMMDCPDLVRAGLAPRLGIACSRLFPQGWGSVLGNTMDRGVGYTPYGDHFSQHCSMTLVLPNGEILNTGMGAAGAENASRYLFNYGFGPYMDGIFTQSNYAICTEMGVNLAPHPGGYQSYLCVRLGSPVGPALTHILPCSWTFENESDLPQIVELMRPLRISGVFGHVAQLRHSLVDIACLGTCVVLHQNWPRRRR